jgi:hypothetical protein
MRLFIATRLARAAQEEQIGPARAHGQQELGDQIEPGRCALGDAGVETFVPEGELRLCGLRTGRHW